jgi:hypothetical protein
MPQENNMAEVLRLLRTLIVKTDGLATDMKKVETRFDRVDAKVDFLAGRFEDVARVVIEDTQRITSLEGRVDILESKAN